MNKYGITEDEIDILILILEFFKMEQYKPKDN